MTERLYFADAYLATFSARIMKRRTAHGQQQIALDRSAFYPAGGGQPADAGTLNGVAVRDVQVEDNTVWHTVAAAIDDDMVDGAIDFVLRFDHMQQHCGQHLLSAAFERLAGLKTIGFHLGHDRVTIDLDTPQLTMAQTNAAQAEVQRVIRTALPIHARFVRPAELATIALRKPPAIIGQVRVVSVPGFDDSACGGTHPRNTAEVELVVIMRWERRGTTTRVEFVCGERAQRLLRQRVDTVAQLATQLSVAPDDLNAALARLRDEGASLRQNLADAYTRLVVARARELATTSVVQHLLDEDLGADGPRQLAQALAAQGSTAIIGVPGERPQIIVARAADQTFDCGALLRTVLARHGGRGGGRPEQAQGGVPDTAALSAAMAELAAAVEQR